MKQQQDVNTVEGTAASSLVVETCLFFSQTKPGCTLWIKDCPCPRLFDNCGENLIPENSHTVAILNPARGTFERNRRCVA